MQHLFFSSSNDIFSNGLSFQQWHRQLRQTTKSVLREATWYFQMIFRGIEINNPLSLEILCFLDTILSDEFARCWIELSVMESSGEMKKPLSLSSFVTSTAVDMGWIPRQGWNTGERKGWNALKQPLHESYWVWVWYWKLESVNLNI